MRTLLITSLSLFGLAGLSHAAPLQAPVEDISLTPVTLSPNEDLIIVRERSYGAGGVDLTAYGIGTGPVDYVQSIYFRLFKDGNASKAAVAGRVVFPEGSTILGIIVNGTELGGSSDDGVLTQTDAIFGIGTDPDLYSAFARGFETTEAEFVCQATDRTMVFGLSVSNGVDDFRVILDYGSSFPANQDFSVFSYPLPSLGGAPISPGYQIGDVVNTSVPGSGAYIDAGSLIGIPLTTSTGPEVGCDITTTPDRTVFLLRDTSGNSEVDAFDVDRQLPGPGTFSIDSAIMSSPSALTAGPDNLLYALAKGSGYAVMDSSGSITNQVAIQDLTGDYEAMTHIPGGRELAIARDTGSDTHVDLFDVDTLLFTADYPISASVLGSPVGIAHGADGLLYVTGTGSGFVSVDPTSGTVTDIGNSPPAGTYTSLASRLGSNLLYFARNTSGESKIDTYDVITGTFTYDFASFASPSTPIGLTLGPDDLIYVVGRGIGGPAPLTSVDPDTGVSIFTNTCMDFSGNVVAIAFTTPGPQGLYCTAKVNSQGCSAQIGFSGSASLGSTQPFLITCSNVLNNKNGLLFYGLGSNTAPFQGGTLCVQAPISRTSVQNSGGNAGAADCSGTFSFDFNTEIQAGTNPGLTTCVSVFAQYWYRDPQDAFGFGSGLSDALEFEIGL